MLMKDEGLRTTENELIHIGKPLEMDEERFDKWSKNSAKELLSIARKQIASEILAKRDIDTYIGQVKNARGAIPYSHQTLIWNVLADLEDDLVELKKLKEKNNV